jgi:hypothetical protein
MANAYFNGMAIPSNKRNEIPSARLIQMNRFKPLSIVEFSMLARKYGPIAIIFHSFMATNTTS